MDWRLVSNSISTLKLLNLKSLALEKTTLNKQLHISRSRNGLLTPITYFDFQLLSLKLYKSSLITYPSIYILTVYHVIVKTKREKWSLRTIYCIRGTPFLDTQYLYKSLTIYTRPFFMLYGSCFMDHALWILLYGSCFMDPALWIMLYGSYFMDHTLWIILYRSYFMDHALWIMLYGSCFMDHTLWIMLYGSCFMDHAL